MTILLTPITRRPTDGQDVFVPLVAEPIVNPMDEQRVLNPLFSVPIVTNHEAKFGLPSDDSPLGLSGEQNDFVWEKRPLNGSGLPVFDPNNDVATLILGTSGDDYIPGSPSDDEIHGYEGKDSLFGEDGNDTIFGGDGSDDLDGGNGDDVLEGGEGNDDLDGGEGNDILRGDEGDDYIYGEEGNDAIRGGEGNDDLYGEEGNDDLRGDEGNDDLYGSEGDDYLEGGEGNDMLDGGVGNNEAYGGEGNDELYGSGTLYGGAGDDHFEVSTGSGSVLHGEDGNDTLIGTFSEADLLVGGTGVDRYDGRGGGDIYESTADNAQDTFVVRNYGDNNPVDIHGFQLMNDPADTTHDIIELDLSADYYIIEHINTVGVADQTDTLIKSSSSGDTLAVLVDVEIPVLPDNPYINMV